jgi:hypothetical protein
MIDSALRTEVTPRLNCAGPPVGLTDIAVCMIALVTYQEHYQKIYD